MLFWSDATLYLIHISRSIRYYSKIWILSWWNRLPMHLNAPNTKKWRPFVKILFKGTNFIVGGIEDTNDLKWYLKPCLRWYCESRIIIITQKRTDLRKWKSIEEITDLDWFLLSFLLFWCFRGPAAPPNLFLVPSALPFLSPPSPTWFRLAP